MSDKLQFVVEPRNYNVTAHEMCHQLNRALNKLSATQVILIYRNILIYRKKPVFNNSDKLKFVGHSP